MAQSKRPKLLVKKTIFSSWFGTHFPYDGKVHGFGPCRIMLNDQPTPHIYKLISEIGFFFMGPKSFRKQLLGRNHTAANPLRPFSCWQIKLKSRNFYRSTKGGFCSHLNSSVFETTEYRNFEMAVLCRSGAKALEDVDCQNFHEIKKK